MQLPLFDLPSDWVATPVSSLPSWTGAKRLGIDTETYDPNLKTTGPSVRTGGYVVGVSFALEDGPSHYLPVRHYMGGNLPADEVWRYLRDQAAAFDGILVGANLNYDLDFLAEQGVTFPKIKGQRDIQVADPLICELHDSYSLDAIAKRYGFPGKNEDHLRRAAMHYGIDPKADLWKLPAKHVGGYATEDAVLPLRILRRQEKLIEEQDLWQIFDLECRLQPVLLKMKRRGVRIDVAKLDQIEQWSINQELLQVAEIKRLTGRQLQLGDVERKKALVPVLTGIGVKLGTTPSGQPKIDKEALAGLDHPVAQCITRARKVHKLRTTFVASIRTYMVDGRIHSTLNQLRGHREQGDEKGARFGRMSSTDPNLQQQPARDDFAKMWRSIYVPDHEGQLWVSADYSQQEPRMLTHYAALLKLPGAEAAAQRYRDNPLTDNHSMMTRLIYPELSHLEDKDPVFQKARKFAKNIFLGLCYGMGSGKLARSLGLPTRIITNAQGQQREVAGDEAEALLARFHRSVPYVKELANESQKRAAARGYIRTVLGRRCRFPQVGADVSLDRALERDDLGRLLTVGSGYDWTHKALNRLIQGSSGDQTKLAVVMLDEAGLCPQLQVHDEVDGSYDNMDQARRVAEIMETCLPLTVPSRVDLEVGPNWGEAA